MDFQPDTSIIEDDNYFSLHSAKIVPHPFLSIFLLDLLFLALSYLHPFLDDELPHLVGPLVAEPSEVEAGQGVVDPLQEEDDETSLLSEGILSDVGKCATELSLVNEIINVYKYIVYFYFSLSGRCAVL